MRAAEARARADEMKQIEPKAIMLRIADDYEKVAETQLQASGGGRVNKVSSVSKCAQCGADMIAPECSEHVSDCRVRNLWSCEACGYRLEDTVYFSSFGGTSMSEFRR
jgi:hypothetical protein